MMYMHFNLMANTTERNWFIPCSCQSVFFLIWSWRFIKYMLGVEFIFKAQNVVVKRNHFPTAYINVQTCVYRAMFICFVKHLKTIVLKSLKSFFTTLLWVFILTSSFLFHASLSFLLSPLGLLHLLVLSALVEILHHDTNKHVKYKEADDEKKGDEVEQHPRVVVRHRLGFDVAKMWFVFTRNQTRDRKQVENS